MTGDDLLLQNLLVVATAQFVAGGVGLLTRRALFGIVVSGQIMLQGILVAVVAATMYYGDVGGAAWTFLLWGVAASQAAVAVTFVSAIARRAKTTDVAHWRTLRDSEHDPLPTTAAHS